MFQFLISSKKIKSILKRGKEMDDPEKRRYRVYCAMAHMLKVTLLHIFLCKIIHKTLTGFGPRHSLTKLYAGRILVSHI